jgi:hypothetical protein
MDVALEIVLRFRPKAFFDQRLGFPSRIPDA